MSAKVASRGLGSRVGRIVRNRVAGGAARVRARRPERAFHSTHYLRHTQRRQEHLGTLGLPLAGRSVLEVGAGVGDHTSFFMDRGCTVLSTDGRNANVAVLRRRFGSESARILDLDDPDPQFPSSFEVVYCYGTLYHLCRPEVALAYLAARCSGLLLLETCVSFGDEEAVNLTPEPRWSPSQAVSSVGCRPTRPWVRARLQEHFSDVYSTVTQPWHEEFPLDWTRPPPPGRLSRSVFVASRQPLSLPSLTEGLPQRQERPEGFECLA